MSVSRDDLRQRRQTPRPGWHRLRSRPTASKRLGLVGGGEEERKRDTAREMAKVNERRMKMRYWDFGTRPAVMNDSRRLKHRLIYAVTTTLGPDHQGLVVVLSGAVIESSDSRYDTYESLCTESSKGPGSYFESPCGCGGGCGCGCGCDCDGGCDPRSSAAAHISAP